MVKTVEPWMSDLSRSRISVSESPAFVSSHDTNPAIAALETWFRTIASCVSAFSLALSCGRRSPIADSRLVVIVAECLLNFALAVEAGSAEGCGDDEEGLLLALPAARDARHPSVIASSMATTTPTMMRAR